VGILTGIKGGLGIGLQAAKGTAASSITYFQTTSINVNPDQQSQAIPPEIGGQLFEYGTYKAGVMIGGDFAVNLRPGTVGWLLTAFAGTATATSIGGGGYTHSILENQADSANLPYITLVKNVAGSWADEYTDCRIDTMRLDIPAAGIATASFGVAGIGYSQIAVPSMTMDATPPFETCVGSVLLTDAAGGVTQSKMSRVSFDFSNNINRGIHDIGSYVLEDIPVIRKTCRITVEHYLSSSQWFNQVYGYGTTSWDPRVMQTQMDITSKTAKDIVGTTQGRLRLVIPQLDYMTYPVPIQGTDVVRVTMTADLTYNPGDMPFWFELDDNNASYPFS
jgi:hypothetical protein